MKLPRELEEEILARAILGPKVKLPDQGTPPGGELTTPPLGGGDKEVQATKQPRKAPGRPKAASRKKKEGRVRERLIEAACAAHGLLPPVFECQFHPTRRWRFDMLFEGWLAVEVQGGLFVEGRHVRGAALLREHEKLNEAVCLGYSVLFVTPDQVGSGEAWALVARALKGGDQ